MNSNLEYDICKTLYDFICDNIIPACYSLQHISFNDNKNSLNILYKALSNWYSIGPEIKTLFFHEFGFVRDMGKIIPNFKENYDNSNISFEYLIYKDITPESLYVLLKLKDLI